MTGRDRFEQTLPARLEDLAVPRVPSYYDDVIHTTARTRQRPGWSFAERWLPMSTIADRIVTAPRAPMRVIAVMILTLLALAAILIVASGSRQPIVPAPFGVAGNGRVAWVDGTGAIVAANSDGAAPTVIVPGPSNDRPSFSPDGTRLAFIRPTGARSEVVVTEADGSNPISVVTVPSAPGLVWAPDSRSLVLQQDDRLLRYDVRTNATPTVIATGLDTGFDWNVEPAMLFRPPEGDQIAYIRGNAGGKRIVVANADGSSPREILTPQDGLGYADLGGLRWAPDGSQLLVMVTRTADPDSRVFVLKPDGTGLRQVTSLEFPDTIVSEGNAQWSPDGRSLVMQLWLNQPDNPGVQPLIIVDVATGNVREAGSVSNNGFSSFAWSPDGRSILSVTDTGNVEVIDAATGRPTNDRWRADSGATWQRTVP